MKPYVVACKGCKKRLVDPKDELIYVVRSVEKPSNKKTDEGEYWCSQRCMDRRDPVRKEAIAANLEAGLALPQKLYPASEKVPRNETRNTN